MKQIIITSAALVILISNAYSGPLADVKRTVQMETRKGRIPVVVFNIDGTILDNRPRSAAILHDFVISDSAASAEIADTILKMSPEKIDYYIVESFYKCGIKGIRHLFLIESALRYWADNFFTNKYVEADVPVAGAPEYLKSLHNNGAMIVYISGRSREKMLEGTVASLKKCGFPIAVERTMLIMNSDSDSIPLFKNRSYNEISKLGKVVAAFENEPREVNAMKKMWPQAIVFQVEMPHSNDTEPLLPGTAVINSYKIE